jgi:hypothetical protein
MNPLAIGLTLLLAVWMSQQALGATDEAKCSATSQAAPLVVELFTSEGCSSCPPADRWLSGLRGRKDVVALAFHVTYWDRLGWKDRFASAEATERQSLLARVAGASNVYTPQVVASGQDWTRWPHLPTPNRPTPVSLSLARLGDQVTASIGHRSDGADGPLAGYWAVIEDGHASRVSAGENAGENLRHDHVVRLYRPVAPWSGRSALQSTLSVTPGDPRYPRRVVFVVTDGPLGRPLNALALDCGGGH